MATGFTPAPTVVVDEGGSSEFIIVLGVMCGVFFFILGAIAVCCWKLRTRVSDEGRAKATAAREEEAERRKRKELKSKLQEEKERLQKEDPFYEDHLALDMLSNVGTDFDGAESHGGGSTIAGVASGGASSYGGSVGDQLQGGNRIESDDDADADGEEEFLRRWEEQQMEDKRFQEEVETTARHVPEEKRRTRCNNSLVRVPAVTRSRPKGYIHPVEWTKIKQRELHENIGKESYEEMQERLAWVEAGKHMKPAPPLLPYLHPERVESQLRPLAGIQQLTNRAGEVVHDGFHRLHGEAFTDKRLGDVHPIEFGQSERIPPPAREKKLYVDL